MLVDVRLTVIRTRADREPADNNDCGLLHTHTHTHTHKHTKGGGVVVARSLHVYVF